MNNDYQFCICTPCGIGHDPRTGLSAYAIVHGGTDYPHDPGDLGRCLQVSPSAPKHMRTVSPVWAALVDHWQELADTFADEKTEGTGRAPRTYARMRELIEAARA
jgi:hypothetical protein